MSLVEVMVVIAIVLTLMSILAIGVFRVWEESRVQLTWLTLGKVAEQMAIYELAHHQTPRSLSQVYEGEPVPADGWGQSIELTSTPGEDWDLVSFGRDGAEGGTGYGTDLRWSDRSP